jgi:hypothetical protein
MILIWKVELLNCLLKSISVEGNADLPENELASGDVIKRRFLFFLDWVAEGAYGLRACNSDRKRMISQIIENVAVEFEELLRFRRRI